MNKHTAFALWFKEISKNDIPIAGGKGANLGEMTTAGIPVPNGFVVTSTVYFEFLEKTSLKHKILTELSGLDYSNSEKLFEASKRIKTAIMEAEMSEDLKSFIKDYYHELSGEEDKLVAVRSSATAEDLPDASFAGQQETYLNIKGWQNVVKNVQKCWASLFESRAIFYRNDRGFSHFKVGIAVPIQLMVQSDVSGIMFTVNPLTNNREEISIEAAWGLGQPVVSGEVTPDQYIVDKKSGKITYKHISQQTWQMTLIGNVNVSRDYQGVQKLSDYKIKELADIGMLIEKHYARPQDIEWGMEGRTLYIVQSRPVTTLNQTNVSETESSIDTSKNAKVLLEGLSASPGIASGPVRIVKSPKEIGIVQQGDVLVAEMTNPDYVPAMRKARAIVTDSGGKTSHAAIVSRELGVPAVVGCGSATKVLAHDQVITVDGTNGKIYEGNIVISHEVKAMAKSLSQIKTATKVYVNLAEPELAVDMAKRNVDGVGLLRAEFMIANIGTHPRKFIKEGKSREFVAKLAEGMEKFAAAFGERPVVYRATDFKTNEYRTLKGGEEFEGEEANPMLGFRGASRYIADAEVFKLELEALKIVRNKRGHKNLHLMIPFTRTVEQLREVKSIVATQGLRRSGLFKLWMMVEIPSNVILLEEFIKEGIDGVSIGTNDLTMLILGVDRDNAKVAGVYSELDPAVLWALEKIVTTCKKARITCSVCGQAPSEYPELVEKLVHWGITSVSVSPDVLEKTRQIVYASEHKLLAGKKA
ncbi:TPA: phosphoenolpyruvate synthase [candidate division WWE3 bacterium]|uniref:Phosphoenolpyruvate synthase n=5 Tax=Bacteria candidate phyla TaxID=1783234 RepID=A0A0G1MVD6_UNCKA|nr:MAG: Phosphoenolpyruvate synthase [Candidatus Nomurabacteria bacterium GW2011_GWF2_43_8]KKT84722.1 MAG: Phosphoenolpyruvate synthase [candidate division WWE3 bacterium GW2011_GWC2_44_9]OGC53487.1 MAG: phosphoenolpyruvate synthase [candidate division WWE3 bacterium RIFCSPHIGHO2_01_FULL_43_9]HAZ29228.1 phosphoenolpyruvate synthase [candidate division WWE3 bacterium]